MIKVEQCRGCAAFLYSMGVANLTVRCEPEPLDAESAVAALVAGRELWTVQYRAGRPSGLKGASAASLGGLRLPPGDRPTVVVEHRCPVTAYTPVSRPSSPSVDREPDPCPKGRENGVQGAARAVPAPPATQPRTEADPNLRSTQDPTCDMCRMILTAGERYVAIQVGELYIWAQHAEQCP